MLLFEGINDEGNELNAIIKVYINNNTYEVSCELAITLIVWAIHHLLIMWIEFMSNCIAGFL